MVLYIILFIVLLIIILLGVALIRAVLIKKNAATVSRMIWKRTELTRSFMPNIFHV